MFIADSGANRSFFSSRAYFIFWGSKIGLRAGLGPLQFLQWGSSKLKCRYVAVKEYDRERALNFGVQLCLNAAMPILHGLTGNIVMHVL